MKKTKGEKRRKKCNRGEGAAEKDKESRRSARRGRDGVNDEWWRGRGEEK